MLATKSPELKKAVGVLKELSADERTRMLAEDREKARRDMASRLDGAKREGIKIGEQIGEQRGERRGKRIGEQNIVELLKSGKSPEEIIREYGADS